jgi:hypothetical protein
MLERGSQGSITRYVGEVNVEFQQAQARNVARKLASYGQNCRRSIK